MTREETLALLAWQNEAGADICLDETPVDRFAESRRDGPETLKRELRQPAQAPASRDTLFPAMAPIAQMPGEAGAVKTAKEIAAAAASMDALREALLAFDGCGLKKTAKNLVFADGNPEARIMFVGEAPGREEDIQGKPFVGRAGKLLDKMLISIGLDRTKVYIANTVPWRPPGNRDPSAIEIETCLPFIRRQIALCAPDVLVTMGNAATKTLLQTSEGILRARGKWRTIDIEGKTIKVIPTLHPAYLLRSPAQKKLSWRDFIAIKKELENGKTE